MRSGTPWTQSALAVLLAAILFPPLGLLLVWKRPGVGIVLKVGLTLGIVVLAVVHLFTFWNLQMELDGTGMWPIFSFRDAEDHYASIEQDRAGDSPVPAASVEWEDAYWTDFRGPNRDGHYTETAVLTEWPDGGLEELWRKPVGGGYASFVVAGGKAFTIEQRRDQEVVAAYDMETGAEVWANSWRANFRESLGGPGPRATPTWHEGMLFALGAEGELRCLNAANGEVIWRKNILDDNGSPNIQWAMAASPLIVDEKVIVLPGGRG
ncbi:MAG: PQQ-binding-like beta-propeller repeat protein, partial [bacterium]|nr:PQQ-binding-like beta-propeller repeat protein [bacterium]